MQDYKDTYLENQVRQIARLQAESKFIAADEHLTGFGQTLDYPLVWLLAIRLRAGSFPARFPAPLQIWPCSSWQRRSRLSGAGCTW